MAAYKTFVVNRKGELISPFQNLKWTAGRGWAEIIHNPFLCRRGWHAWNSMRVARRRTPEFSHLPEKYSYRRGYYYTKGGLAVIYLVATQGGVRGPSKTAYKTVKLVKVMAIYRDGVLRKSKRLSDFVKS